MRGLYHHPRDESEDENELERVMIAKTRLRISLLIVVLDRVGPAKTTI